MKYLICRVGSKINHCSLFPNLQITLQIYLTLPNSSCSAEKAFSKLARIKKQMQKYLNARKFKFSYDIII